MPLNIRNDAWTEIEPLGWRGAIIELRCAIVFLLCSARGRAWFSHPAPAAFMILGAGRRFPNEVNWRSMDPIRGIFSTLRTAFDDAVVYDAHWYR
jgi:hypothetical protein